MQLEDIAEKIANNARLTSEESAFWKRSMRETQLRNSFIAGNTTAANTLAIQSPLELIYSETLQTTASQFSVSVPGDFKHILIMGSGRTDVVAAGTEIVMQLNGDTGSNYGTTSDGVDNDTFVKGQTNSGTYMVIGLFPGTLATASASGMLFAYVFHANSSDYWKSVISTRGLFSGNMAFLGGFGQWKSTNKITSLTIGTSGNFLAGTTLSVIGIR